MEPELTPLKYVALGPVEVASGGLGGRVMLLSDFEPDHDPEWYREKSSIFKIAANLVVGGVYDSSGLIENNRLVQISFQRTFERRLSDPIVLIWEGEAMANKHRHQAASIEKRFAKNSVMDSVANDLATIMDSLPANTKDAFLEAFVRKVRTQAHRIMLTRIDRETSKLRREVQSARKATTKALTALEKAKSK